MSDDAKELQASVVTLAAALSTILDELVDGDLEKARRINIRIETLLGKMQKLYPDSNAPRAITELLVQDEDYVAKRKARMESGE